jgi:hypothetical protein
MLGALQLGGEKYRHRTVLGLYFQYLIIGGVNFP